MRLQFYNSLDVGPEVKAEHVAGLNIEGVAEPSGSRALTVPPKHFVGIGGTINVHIILRPDVVDALLPAAAQTKILTNHVAAHAHKGNQAPSYSQTQPMSPTSAVLISRGPASTVERRPQRGAASPEAMERVKRIAVLEKQLAETNAEDNPLTRILDEIRFVRSP